MKQIKTFIAALVIITAASSCKKENQVIQNQAPAATGTKLSKIEYANGTTNTYSYDANGRLASAKVGAYTNKYTYAAAPFSYEEFNSSNVKSGDIFNVVFSSNKMTSYEYRSFSGGVANTGVPETTQYDVNGYQLKKTNSSSVYDYSISEGNTVKLIKTYTASGATAITNLEYYTDKPNKFNLNLFENWMLDQFLSDMEVHGKKNNNLVKKVTYISGTTTTVFNYVYVLNAQGMVTEATETYTVNGSTPTTSTSRFSYE